MLPRRSQFRARSRDHAANIANDASLTLKPYFSATVSQDRVRGEFAADHSKPPPAPSHSRVTTKPSRLSTRRLCAAGGMRALPRVIFARLLVCTPPLPRTGAGPQCPPSSSGGTDTVEGRLTNSRGQRRPRRRSRVHLGEPIRFRAKSIDLRPHHLPRCSLTPYTAESMSRDRRRPARGP